MFCNLNGRLLPADAPALSLANRAFRYGLGLFETLRMQEGILRLEAMHWARLRQGMEVLGILPTANFFEVLAYAVRETARRNAVEKSARIRLQVWPGSGGYTAGNWQAEYCVECTPMPADFDLKNGLGLSLGLARGLTKTADSLSRFKTSNALPLALAARQAQARGWDEALLCNQHGRVAEGSISNLFWMESGTLFSPPTSEGAVAGVMRQHLLHYLPSLGYPVREEPADPERLLHADGIWLSNALRGLRWARTYEGRPKSAGAAPELQRRIMQEI